LWVKVALWWSPTTTLKTFRSVSNSAHSSSDSVDETKTCKKNSFIKILTTCGGGWRDIIEFFVVRQLKNVVELEETLSVGKNAVEACGIWHLSDGNYFYLKEHTIHKTQDNETLTDRYFFTLLNEGNFSSQI
jgi:hypothetical protein